MRPTFEGASKSEGLRRQRVKASKSEEQAEKNHGSDPCWQGPGLAELRRLPVSGRGRKNPAAWPPRSAFEEGCSVRLWLHQVCQSCGNLNTKIQAPKIELDGVIIFEEIRGAFANSDDLADPDANGGDGSGNRC